jgi:predicted MFS family arabinose efflux permease
VVETTVPRSPDAVTGPGRARAGIAILALACFAAVSTEMVPVGLLPAIGRAFGVSESTTGLLVTLYAVMVAVLAVPLTFATRRIAGKHLLLAALAGYALSNLVAALAPSFALLAAARALGGLTHAVFFSVCIGYASRLVPARQTGRALAFVSAGVSGGFVLGVPLATAVGNAAGWRAGFATLTVLTALTLGLIALWLPDVRIAAHADERPTGRRRWLVAVATSNGLAFMGQYTVYTYISVLLLDAGAGVDAVGPVLLVLGAVGLAGLAVTARHLDHQARRTGLAALAVVVAGTVAAGAGLPHLDVVLAAAVVWNAAYGGAPSFFQASVVRARATTPELAGAWINATSNVGIAAGAAVGGLVLDAAGIRAVAWLAAGLVVASMAVVLACREAFSQH